jgi:glycosyltransferase involved in cell wall biosynthesis
MNKSLSKGTVDMQKLVSILIPAYNAEKWIADTVESVLAQTWQKKEIIIVDDGSTDNTLEIAMSYESKIVKVITQQNTGVCGTRNRALEVAQGDYIQWLDADDLLASDKISKQLNSVDGEGSPKVLLTSAWAKFYFNIKRAKFVPDALWQNLEPVEWIMTKFKNNVWMNPAVWLMSRQLADIAGPWDERLSISGDDDGEYICRVIAASEGVRFIPEARCYYRIGNAGSLDWNMGKSTEKCESLFLSLSLSINHLLSIENSERTRMACVKHLQTWLPSFYPERKELLSKMNSLAHQLGGSMTPPQISWKYSPIRIIFGWNTAMKAMHKWGKTKLLLNKNIDRLLHNINGK